MQDNTAFHTRSTLWLLLAALVFLVAIGLLLLPTSATGSARSQGPVQVVSGTIVTDTVWLSGTTYVATADVGVAPGVTLTLQSGVRVEFCPACRLNVGGTLIAAGTVTNPIVLVGNDLSSGSWLGITITAPSPLPIVSEEGLYQSGNTLQHVRVEGGVPLRLVGTLAYVQNLTMDGSLHATDALPGRLWVLDSVFTGDVRGSPMSAHRTQAAGLFAGGDHSVVVECAISDDARFGQHAMVRDTTVGGNAYLGQHATMRDSNVGGSLMVESHATVQNCRIGLGIEGDLRYVENVTIEDSQIGAHLSRSGRPIGIAIRTGAVRRCHVRGGNVWFDNDGQVIDTVLEHGSIRASSGEVLSCTVRYGGISVDAGRVEGCTVEMLGGWDALWDRPAIEIHNGEAIDNRIVDASGAGIRVVDEGRVEGNLVAGCGGDGLTIETGTVVNNLIDGCLGHGLVIGTGTVVSNTIHGVGGDAILVQGTAGLRISGNNIVNPGGYALRLQEPEGQMRQIYSVDATHNWWGATDAAVIDAAIYDYDDDWRLGNVHYQPMLHSPSVEAPAYVTGIAPWYRPSIADELVVDVRYSRPMSTSSVPTAELRRESSWGRHADLLAPVSMMGAAALDERLYVVSGLGLMGFAVDAVQVYAPESNTWQWAASIPTPRIGLAAIAGPDGLLYAMGGTVDGSTSTRVEAYDPVTGQWSRRADMPAPRRDLTLALAGGRIVALGGNAHSGDAFTQYIGRVDVYDPFQDGWLTLPEMALPGEPVAAGPVGEDLLVLCLSARFTYSVYRLDVQSGVCTHQIDIPVAKPYHAASFYAGRFYLVMGRGYTWAPRYGFRPRDLDAGVLEIDPTTGRVTDLANVDRIRPQPALVVAPKEGITHLYMLGGGIKEYPWSTYACAESLALPHTTDIREHSWVDDRTLRLVFGVGRLGLLPYRLRLWGVTALDGMELAPSRTIIESASAEPFALRLPLILSGE